MSNPIKEQKLDSILDKLVITFADLEDEIREHKEKLNYLEKIRKEYLEADKTGNFSSLASTTEDKDILADYSCPGALNLSNNEEDELEIRCSCSWCGRIQTLQQIDEFLTRDEIEQLIEERERNKK